MNIAIGVLPGPIMKELQAPAGKVGKTDGFTHIVAEALEAFRPR